MQQNFEAINQDDINGNPAGGLVTGKGLFIEWQKGPLVVEGERQEPNGAFVETVIAAAKQRIDYYQRSRFKCVENERAVQYLQMALEALGERTKRRELAGVEGTQEGN